MNRFLCRVLFFCLLPGAGIVGITGRGVATKESTLRVLFSAASFASVNRNDALASSRAWIESVGRRRGIDLTVRADTYENPVELRRILEEGEADLLIVDSMDYLSLQDEKDRWDPLFVPQTGSSMATSYLLLTRNGQGTRLSDLRGTRVLCLKDHGANLARRWVDNLLQGSGLGKIEAFFGSVQDVSKASAAVLPVFFRQADVCIVDQSGFEVMKEMNPQVGTKLQVLLTSPPYLEIVICVHKHKLEYRQDLIDGLAELHKDPAGRQIMMVFKIDRLAPFREELLNTVRALRPVPGHLQQAKLP